LSGSQPKAPGFAGGYLLIVMENGLDSENPPSAYGIKDDMDKAGYTSIAAVLSIKSLERKGLIRAVQATSYNGDEYAGYTVTAAGEEWLFNNQGQLVMKKNVNSKRSLADFPGDPPF
jgi:DNA-binding PadR family transcriptional regulator